MSAYVCGRCAWILLHLLIWSSRSWISLRSGLRHRVRSPIRNKGLLRCDDHLTLCVEVHFDDRRLFTERRLCVVPKETCPPSAAVVLEEASSPSTWDSFVAHPVWTVDAVGHCETGGIPSFILVRRAQMIATVGLEQHRAFRTKIVRAASDALGCMMRWRMIRICERDGTEILCQSGKIIPSPARCVPPTTT